MCFGYILIPTNPESKTLKEKIKNIKNYILWKNYYKVSQSQI